LAKLGVASTACSGYAGIPPVLKKIQIKVFEKNLA
jgi:hypothetical protein